jgi:hypothetical protein
MPWVLCLVLTGSFLTDVVSAAQEGVQQGPPPVRKIPGINMEDRFPEGCVDCHLHYEDMKLDTRFSTMMAQWVQKVDERVLAKAQASSPSGLVLEGVHPNVPGSLESIPAKCLSCHGKGAKAAPPFARMIHTIHLTGGEENHFLSVFQGECTHCHKLDLSTGAWSVPSAPEKRETVHAAAP